MNNCVWLLETKWPNGWKPIGRVYRTERNAANAKAQMERHEYDGIEISAIYEKEEDARTVVEELRELHKTEDFDYEEWEVL